MKLKLIVSDNYGHIVQINVKALAPPEPMVKILKVLSTLSEHQLLKIYHRREPFPLYEQLEILGWDYHCKRKSDDDFELYIYKPENKALLKQQLKLADE